MIRHQPSPAAVTQANLPITSRSRHGTIDRETNLNTAQKSACDGAVCSALMP